MYKLFKRVAICGILAALCWTVALVSQRRLLSDSIIRLHVVAASDNAEDQAVKLKVRDAVLQSIQEDLGQIKDLSLAKQYLQENLPKLQTLVVSTLESNGFSGEAQVTLGKEAFPIRRYDTFTLPSGVYESLRITIGEGQGKNWWCVAFPTLCIPATSEDFETQAVSAGFPEVMARTLAANEEYTIRFYLLDRLGQLQNNLFRE